MSDAPLPSSFDGDTDFYEENRWQKFSRKLKEEPLIPLGIAATCYAFYQAGRAIHHGDSLTANRMFRQRLYAQSFTLVAMVAGSMYYKKDRIRRKEFEGVIAEKKAKEKNEAWIRELEARDREDKEWRVRMGKIDAAEAMAVEREKQEQKETGSIVAAVKELVSDNTNQTQKGMDQKMQGAVTSLNEEPTGLTMRNSQGGTGKQNNYDAKGASDD